MMALILFVAGVLGFSLLKAYDEFQKAIETKSRVRLWLSFSSVMLLLIAVVVGFSGIGSSIGKNRNLTLRIPLERTQQDSIERSKH
jgi:predicted PurR-regulated permease PerM